MTKYGKVDEKFADNLTIWAEVIRKTFYDGGVDEIISTRRLDHIVKAFSIFNDKMKSIELCVSRFDDDTKDSFMDLYTKIDAGEDVQGISDSDEDLDDPVDETGEFHKGHNHTAHRHGGSTEQDNLVVETSKENWKHGTKAV